MARKQHHGGSWKVAYADFVTAMMALFMVLWLTSQDPKILQAVERSFRHPFSSLTKDSTGIIPNEDSPSAVSEKGSFDSASVVELNMLRRLAQELSQSLAQDSENPESNPAKLELLPEGLRISVFDRARRPVFEQGSAQFTPYGEWVFTTLAWQVARYTNAFKVELEGHTERGYPPPRPDYGDWEISADRANIARRLLIEHGVHEEQIRKVAGYADTQPMTDRPPADEANRRVALLLRIRDDERKSSSSEFTGGKEEKKEKPKPSQVKTLSSVGSEARR